MKRLLSRLNLIHLALLSVAALTWPQAASGQRLLLAYDFNQSSAPYVNAGELTAPLTARGTYQAAGAEGSGVSGLPGDRAWDASANTTQGAATPANNSALTTPASGLDLSKLSGFTIAFWFKTEQSLDADAALRFVYKADRATTPVGQGLTLRSFSGRLELRIANAAGETVVNSFDFASGSGYNKVGSWIFVAFTWDGSTVQFYCGGRDYRIVLASSGAFTGPMVNYPGELILANTAAFNRGLDGWIDNFRFYDAALTKAELEALRLTDAGISATPPVGGPLRPMAPDFSVIAAGEAGAELGGTQMARLSSGRLLVSYEQRPAGAKDDAATTIICSSDDGGINWTPTATLPLSSVRLFTTSTGPHALGLRDGALAIVRSTDDGASWSSPVSLDAGSDWHRSAGNVWQTADQVAFAMMRRVARTYEGWTHADLAPVLFQASANADLTLPASWRRSTELPLGALFEKFSPTRKAGRFFGVPFRQPSSVREADAFEHQALSPVGWLDANVVQVLDAQHYWYNAAAPTWHLMTRAHTGGAGLAALAKVVEQPDGTLVTAAETAPSGKLAVFLPLPGGEDRFHVSYDATSGLYWLLSTLPENSMRRPERGGTSQTRHALALHFSRNLVDWCFAAVVADNSAGEVGDATMQIDNLDLAIVSRTRASGANPELITSRRLRNFRDLVY